MAPCFAANGFAGATGARAWHPPNPTPALLPSVSRSPSAFTSSPPSSALSVSPSPLPHSLPPSPFAPTSASYYAHQNALHERKWLAFLGLSVALYLNPVMIVGNFVAPGSASWGLASEMSLSVAIAVFLVVALCIADGIGRSRAGGGSSGRCMGFYVPKVGEREGTA